MVTGYDWSDFFNAFGLLDKALKPSGQKYSLIDNYNPPMKNKTSYEKLQRMSEITKLPKIAPIYSFYASEVSYGQNDSFKEIARPFKVSGNKPTTLKIEEFTNTYSNMFDLSNLEIVQKSKYGSLQESANKNGKKEFVYTSNQEHKNDLDEFIYKVKSTQKDGVNGNLINKQSGETSKTGSADIYFKVQLYQEDGTYKWTSPEVNNDALKLEEKVIDKNSDVNVAGIKVYNATQDNNDVLDQTATNNAFKLFDNNYYGEFWEPGNAFGKMKMVIPFNKTVDLNTFTLMPRRFNNREIPTDIEIYYKDPKTQEKKKILYDTYTFQYSGNTNNARPSTYSFSDISTNELTIVFNRREEKGNTIDNTHFKFAQLSFGHHMYQNINRTKNTNFVNVIRKNEY